MRDTTALRMCLKAAGFKTSSHSTVFNDKRKHSTRRLKLWNANSVFDAPHAQQQKLEKLLKRTFKARYTTGYFIARSHWYYEDVGKSLCIMLQD